MKTMKMSHVSGVIVSVLCLLAVFISAQTMSFSVIIALILSLAMIGVFVFGLITARKVEDEVLEKFHWYEQIIDLWENPLSITDLDMNWTFINKTVEGLLGKTRDEVKGQQCSNWGANICKTENCGVHCLRKGKLKTFFFQWDTNFRVNTHYLKNRKGDNVGHVEIVTNIHAQKQLSQLIKNTKLTAENVSSGARELTNSAQSLSAGATEQAASIEEITSSLNEVGAQTKLNSKNAEQAKILSNDTRQTVQTGNEQMAVMVESMKTINETSSEVSKVIKVIDDIAFQTNLLALNAAVEAARAGKYGKGFAVVAEEVRALAGRSAAAAKDTTELIEKSIRGVEAGVKNADETAGILSGIVTSMDKMNDLVSEIATSSIDQNSSIEQVNEGLAQVNTVVQQNASISEQNASASEELNSQVSQLVALTENIQVTEDIGEEDNVPEKHSTPKRTEIKPVKRLENPNPARARTPRLVTLDDDSFGKY